VEVAGREKDDLEKEKGRERKVRGNSDMLMLMGT
jgi:hypothetical protein